MLTTKKPPHENFLVKHCQMTQSVKCALYTLSLVALVVFMWFHTDILMYFSLEIRIWVNARLNYGLWDAYFMWWITYSCDHYGILSRFLNFSSSPPPLPHSPSLSRSSYMPPHLFSFVFWPFLSIYLIWNKISFWLIVSIESQYPSLFPSLLFVIRDDGL